jgi:hypothetical protein
MRTSMRKGAQTADGPFIALVLFGLGILLAASAFAADTPPPVKHPNLLLNRDEIDAIKSKIARNDWAARLFEQTKALAAQGNQLEAALCYALTGEKSYGDSVRRTLVSSARGWSDGVRQTDIKLKPEAFAWDSWGRYAWAYDLTWDTFSDEERKTTEDGLRAVCKLIIEGDKLYTTTPNLVFGKHHNVGLVGYALGDGELIDWGLNDPGAFGPAKGGFYAVLDSMIRDGHFWGEAPTYALFYDVHGMIALAEAARHYDGTDLYAYTSKKSGASIKSILDGYLLLSFPLERTGINGGSVRLATFGDGSTWFGPNSELRDTFIVNPVSGKETSGRGTEATLSGELEAAYSHYKDSGYAWLLSLNPNRNAYTVYGRAAWSYVALTHGSELPPKPTPPPAPCGIYPSQGFAVLRADESPAYWTSGSLAAVMRLGASVGHGHDDYYSLILHGKGRLLYPDVNVIQYEPTYLNWTHEGIAHSTLLIDGESPHAGEFAMRNDFTPEAKFFAASGSAFDHTRQTRALLLTKEYLADVFRVTSEQSGKPRTFDWVLHGLGRLYLGNPAAYRPSTGLLPHYWWVDNERSRTTDAGWQADFVQHGGGVLPGVQALGKEWFEQTAGVRMSMLGAHGTEVFGGDGPLVDGPPYPHIYGNPEGSLPLVIARRTGSAATFAAVHEPYDWRPSVRVRRIAETDDAIALAVATDAISDVVLAAFAPGKEQTLKGAQGESFVFSDYGYIRRAGRQITVRGRVSAFKLPLPGAGDATVMVNGSRAATRRVAGFVVFGNPPSGKATAPEGRPDVPAERSASLHYYFMPEEVHLPAGKERQIELRLRCLGSGKAKGQLAFAAPVGITLEPATVEIPEMADGEERTILVRVKAAAEATNALYTVNIKPTAGTPAAPGELAVAVGVVITKDTLRPRSAEFVIRAPGYTMRVDLFSGTSYYLLDADGHRRFGRMNGPANFIFGFPGIMRDGKWCFVFRNPCRRVVQRDPNTLTVDCDGTYNDHDARLGYTFLEDRVVMKLVPLTRTDVEHTMWLGNFDTLLGTPRKGTVQSAGGSATDWYFFPHPVLRQGVLLMAPGKTQVNYYDGATIDSAVNLVLRAGQEVTLKFATPEEVPAE